MLTLDGSEAGAATFNSSVTATDFVVGGKTLSENISDTVGAMFSSNTESVSYTHLTLPTILRV